MTNECLMQCFEWYLPNDGTHWQNLTALAPQLAQLGITKVWLPPATKGTSANDVGYGIYDLFDLGEFDQKGTVRTKYGTKQQYLELINTLKTHGIDAIADVVLNHKGGADDKEVFTVMKMDPNHRQQPLSEPYEIESWTKFDFPGRQGKYNDFVWHWYHFTGVDFDATNNENGIYMIVGDNKGWANNENVDSENGNYDYLMYADIDYRHPEVVENIYTWAKWFIETTQICGFRLDAVKHIDSQFTKEFVKYIREQQGDEFYVFGEFWKSDENANDQYLEATNYQFDLVDVVLHHNFFAASQQDNYDLRKILDGSLMQTQPLSAVTFVDNHDTQRGQALQSTVEEWFKPLAYSLILLREEGLPCVFYGDYFGIEGEFYQQSFKTILDKLLYLRLHYAYGQQDDYFDDAQCIGWVRHGDEAHPQPLVALISTVDTASKRMFVGTQYAGQLFADYLGHVEQEVVIDDEGFGQFMTNTHKLSAWSIKEID